VSVRFATEAELVRHFRSHFGAQLYDDSGIVPRGTAIYSLSDPRDIRQVRYVGQTSAPKRRLLQHLNTAMLWIPVETPWWVKSPKLRPLAGWIRALQMWKERAHSRYRRFALGAETSTEYSHEHAPSRQNFGFAAAVRNRPLPGRDM